LAPLAVHAHGARAALPTALAARGAWRFVYTVHGFHFPLKPPVVRQVARSAEAFCIARADCTVFVSDGDVALAMRSRLPPASGKFRLIKNAVDLECDVLDTSKRYDIGFAGRVHPQKNPLILVDILKGCDR
jgi:glycosyltransferase involved in cell wall biosynthesis